jgi:hypothetical protein
MFGGSWQYVAIMQQFYISSFWITSLILRCLLQAISLIESFGILLMVALAFLVRSGIFSQCRDGKQPSNILCACIQDSINKKSLAKTSGPTFTIWSGSTAHPNISQHSLRKVLRKCSYVYRFKNKLTINRFCRGCYTWRNRLPFGLIDITLLSN